MTHAIVAEKLRRFLLVIAGVYTGAIAVELYLVGHTGNVVQYIPFALACVMITSVVASLARPTRRVLRTHRVLMVVVTLGSAFGVYEHVEENIAFAREIRPIATFGDVWLEGFRGANPLLAPGLLALAAVLGFAGTYGHHALGATSGDEVR